MIVAALTIATSESRQSAEGLVRTDPAFNGHDLAASIIPRHAEMIGSDEANTVVFRRAVRCRAPAAFSTGVALPT
jgi:hypothetical protein